MLREEGKMINLLITKKINKLADMKFDSRANDCYVSQCMIRKLQNKVNRKTFELNEIEN